MKTAVAHKWLLLILGLYLIIATGYSVTTPLFEAPDENHHFFNALTIAETGQLPRVDENIGPARQEAAQPPLYYLLGALLIGPVDVGDAEAALQPNPFVQLGNGNTPDNTNAYVHTPAEDFPWRGLALAVHLFRYLSVLLGLGTLIFLYQSAQLIWPDAPEKGLLALALVAFLPQFGFLHGTISNDTLMIFVATAVLYQLLLVWQDGVTNGRLLLLGLLLGLGLLAKTTGLLLLVWAGGWLVLLVGQRNWHLWGKLIRLVLLPALLVGGWWLVRNWLLYGDPTAANQFVALAGGNRHFALSQIWAELDRVWLSAIAYFGWMTVRTPLWLHWIWGGLGVLAIGGLVWQASRTAGAKRRWLLGAVLASWFLLVGVGWLQFMRQTAAEQGRLLFPALAASALLVSAGLAAWLPRKGYLAVAGLALLTTLYSLVIVLPAAYALPQPLMLADIPETAVRLEQGLGQGIELLAVEQETANSYPGHFLFYTFYWRARELPATPPTLVIELLGRDQALVGKLLSYHGNGRFPATHWQPNQIYQDSFGVQLAADMQTPTLVRPFVHLLDEPTVASLPPVAVRSLGEEALQTAVATFGDGIDLILADGQPAAVSAGSQMQVELVWQVTASPQQALTTFIHLGNQTHPPLAQADGQPLQGDYPSQFWAASDQINDAYTLTIPTDVTPGEYPLYVGLYEATTGTRLPVLVDGAPQPFAAYLVGRVTIRP